MTFNYMRDSASDSQNFILQLSDDSTIEDTHELVANKKKEEDNIIVISDSSCSSSPKHFEKSKWGPVPGSRSKTREVKYKRLYISETSSEDEEKKINLPWRLPVRSDKPLNKKYTNNVQNRKVFYTSDETTTSSDMSNDRNTKKQTSKFDIKNSCTSTTLTPMKQKIRQPDTDANKEHEIYNVKETNIITTPNSVAYSSSSSIKNKLNQFTIDNTPEQNNAGKVKLTKKDAHKIFSNIISTKMMYNSPRQIKETNIIIDESTDREEDLMHPALLPRNNGKVHGSTDSLNVIETSSKNDIIPDSQSDLLKPYNQTHGSRFIDTSKDEDFHKPLSDRKKKQIAEWLITNQPDSQSDSSCSNIPASTRNSVNSGNSSLERLELNYETPNNRGKVNKIHNSEEQSTIMNRKEEIQLFSTQQSIVDRSVQKYKNNSEFRTPDRPTILPKVYTDKKISSSSAVNRSEGASVKNCEDILDLCGTWRNKANLLLPTTEPRKETSKTVVKSIQTERKPISKDKYYALDRSESNSVKNNIRSISRKQIQRKHKKQNSFINDESISSDNDESMYHTALTNFRTSTNSTTPKQRYIKPKPVSTLTKRVISICDTDTEDEINDKSSNDSKKSLRGRRLSFSDDDSNTSEFDPGDYVPPKPIPKKKTTNTQQPSKVTTKSGSVTSRFLEHKSFLASLSSTIPMNNVHPDAKKYRLDYKNRKEELCKELYKMYNKKVFDDKLPQDMPIEWNIRMRGTAGYCYNKKSVRSLSGVVRSSRIVLATKILDAPDRLRDTLIHEMCHAAAWLINNVSDGHGPFWTKWADKAMKTFPELPPIRRCHDYEIKTKFTYRCTDCGYSIGRHSKSLNIEQKRCGYCFGKFELLINKTTKSGTVQMQTPKKEPSGFALYVKQNYNSVKKEKNNVKHADVMKILGQQFSALKIAKKNNPAIENNPETSG